MHADFSAFLRALRHFGNAVDPSGTIIDLSGTLGRSFGNAGIDIPGTQRRHIGNATTAPTRPKPAR
jgi:hypothetical protein